MTLLFTEGFDVCAAAALASFGKWLTLNSSASGVNQARTIALATGRFGTGSALQWSIDTNGVSGTGSSSMVATADLLSEHSVLFVAMGFRDDSMGFSAPTIFQLQDENQATQLDVRYLNSTSKALTVTRNGTLLCTSAAVLSPGTWTHIQLACKISPTVGWAELYVNATLSASYYGASGTSRATANGNTRASAISGARIFQMGQSLGFNNSTVKWSVDDIVINDDQGTINNDVMGDVRVIGLLPNGNGSNTNFTRVGGTGAGNYTAVSESAVDSDTSYVASSIVGTIDTYAYTDLPSATSSVLGVMAYPIVRRDDSGTRKVTVHVRSNNSEADSPSAQTTLALAYGSGRHVMETNPVTGAAWSVSDVNAAEFGQKITA